MSSTIPVLPARETSDSRPDAREPTRLQPARWRRSTWHRLLLVLDQQLSAERALLARLVDAEYRDIEVWISGTQPMPLYVQWRMALVGEYLTRSDSPCARLSRNLRCELEARAAFLRRGKIHDETAPYYLQVHTESRT